MMEFHCNLTTLPVHMYSLKHTLGLFVTLHNKVITMEFMCLGFVQTISEPLNCL